MCAQKRCRYVHTLEALPLKTQLYSYSYTICTLMKFKTQFGSYARSMGLSTSTTPVSPPPPGPAGWDFAGTCLQNVGLPASGASRGVGEEWRGPTLRFCKWHCTGQPVYDERERNRQAKVCFSDSATISANPSTMGPARTATGTDCTCRADTSLGGLVGGPTE